MTISVNPRSLGARTIPQTFDVRPGPAVQTTAGQLLDYPDELMIDWGNAPIGSVASIYWPQIQGIDVVRSASRLHGVEELSLSDPNTLQCTVNGGITYVPISSGVSQRIAGLLTLVLPDSVVEGQQFNILVRRISTRQVDSVDITATSRTESTRPIVLQQNWRYIVGSFQIKIPIVAEKDILLPQENIYSIMLWRLNQLVPTSRWYPVLLRYLSQIALRITATGGDPSTIVPSPTGVAPQGSGGGVSPWPINSGAEQFDGKVAGVVYDRFGDFEGFLLITETGHEHRFRAVEPELEDLVLFAWAERVVISVYVHPRHRERPISIVLRRPPRKA